MTHFSQVMHDWKRMCDKMDKTHGEEACSYCPIFHTDTIAGCCDAIYEDLAANIDWDKVASIVEAWATEHPEPVYPTWAEWLIEQGLAEHKTVFSHEYHADALYVTDFDTALNKAVHKPIPANIAEKLGLKPKEGENNV